jgi:hypothetical protein
MKRFIYKNKKTGKRVYSNTKLTDVDLVLVVAVKDGQIKNNDNVIQK